MWRIGLPGIYEFRWLKLGKIHTDQCAIFEYFDRSSQSASKASLGLDDGLLHHSLKAKYIAIDGLVTQNTNRSVATAGM